MISPFFLFLQDSFWQSSYLCPIWKSVQLCFSYHFKFKRPQLKSDIAGLLKILTGTKSSWKSCCKVLGSIEQEFIVHNYNCLYPLAILFLAALWTVGKMWFLKTELLHLQWGLGLVFHSMVSTSHFTVFWHFWVHGISLHGQSQIMKWTTSTYL